MPLFEKDTDTIDPSDYSEIMTRTSRLIRERRILREFVQALAMGGITDDAALSATARDVLRRCDRLSLANSTG